AAPVSRSGPFGSAIPPIPCPAWVFLERPEPTLDVLRQLPQELCGRGAAEPLDRLHQGDVSLLHPLQETQRALRTPRPFGEVQDQPQAASADAAPGLFISGPRQG